MRSWYHRTLPAVSAKEDVLPGNLSLSTLLLIAGFVLLAAAVVVVALKLGRTNRRLDAVSKALALEQRRTRDLARRMGIIPPSDAEMVRMGEGRAPHAMQEARGMQEDDGSNARRRPSYPEGASGVQTRRRSGRRGMQEPEQERLEPTLDMDELIGRPQPRGEQGGAPRQAPRQATARDPRMGGRTRYDAYAAYEAAAPAPTPREPVRHSQGLTPSSAWLDDRETRFADRMQRQQMANRRREERQQAQLRRQAEAIVQQHMREAGEAHGMTAQ